MDTEIKKKHAWLRKYGWIIGGGIVMIALIGWGLINSTTSTYRTDSVGLLIEDVTEGAFNDYIRINGKVETGTIVQVSALETGIVKEKLVEEGASVTEGQIILVLHNPNLQQQILDSESQLAEKQNMLRDTELAMEKERLQVKQDLLSARTELNRKKRLRDQQETLYEENLTSREEYLKADEDYKLANESLKLLENRLHQDSMYRDVQISLMKESLANMQQNFSLVRQRADNLNVRASHSGQLGSLTAELGQNISAGTQVGQINILDNYKIVVKIDEHYIDRVEPGLKGKTMRQHHQYDVEVKKVYPEVTNGQFKADLSISNDIGDNIRVGQSFPIDLMLGDAVHTVMIPRGTFYQTTGGKWIYVMSEDGKTATRRDIKIGRQNPHYYEVLEGLVAGERVITSSYTNFGEADKIIINN
ncbi:MAG: HlyD family efflux transporter periplasmic adaptor subunit [Bacteroides sp.]|nr:HlyD family efflux transporter periplasmic adaptor subunit [Bacteroides sp.]